jgi:hypothetical protein
MDGGVVLISTYESHLFIMKVPLLEALNTSFPVLVSFSASFQAHFPLPQPEEPLIHILHCGPFFSCGQTDRDA